MKTYPLLLLMLFLFPALRAQEGWKWVNPKPQGNPLNSIGFLRHYGMAVGQGGTALHTTDGGDTWRIVDLGIRENLTSVVMHDDLMAFASGDQGSIYWIMYHDSRDTFEVKKLPSGTDQPLHAVTTHINDCQWAAGSGGTVLRSEDFGATWESKNSLYKSDLYDIDMIECTSAWGAGGDGMVIYTSDWGMTWESRSPPTSIDLYAVDVGTFENIRVCGQQGNIWHTGDRGVQWSKEFEQTGAILYDIENVGLNSAYAAGAGGLVLETIDYGEHWNPLEAETASDLYDLYYHGIGYSDLWAVGYYGTMLKNSGIGEPMELQNQGTMDWLFSVDLKDDTLGWAAGGNAGWGGEESGLVMKTTDGGTTWETTQLFDRRVNEIDMLNATRGWLVGDDGMVRTTNNGGASWVGQTAPVTTDLFGVSFADEDHGWAVSRYAEIIHTSDGGVNWTKQSSPSPNPLHDVFAVSSSVAFAVGLDSTVIRTQDGGNNWERLVTHVSRGYRFASVFFLNENFGCAAGIYGGIIITEDGGDSWTEVDSRTDVILEDVFFIDRNNGWISGDRGTILRTIDGGKTWFSQQTCVTNNYIAGIRFTDTGHGVAVGEAGTIVRTDNGGFYHGTGTFIRHRLNLPVNDLATLRDTVYLEIADERVLTGLEVYIDTLLHDAPGELKAVLRHGELSVTLFEALTGSGANIMWLTLSDDAETAVGLGTSPYCGSYSPASPLSAFHGCDPSGEWILEIHDDSEGHNGTLVTWGIRPVFETVPESGNSIDPSTAFAANEFLYPNPVTETAILEWTQRVTEPIEITIYNQQGRITDHFHAGTRFPGKQVIALDASGYPEGICFVRISGRQTSRMLKFVVVH